MISNASHVSLAISGTKSALFCCDTLPRIAGYPELGQTKASGKDATNWLQLPSRNFEAKRMTAFPNIATKRGDALSIFGAAVRAVLPAVFLPGNLPPPPQNGRICIIAAGKAAGSMAKAAEDLYLDQLGVPPSRLFGLAIARHGYGCPLRVLESLGAGHPVPDDAGLVATRRPFELLQCGLFVQKYRLPSPRHVVSGGLQQL